MAAKDEQSGGTTLLAPELMARVRQIQIRTHDLISDVLQGAYRSTFRGTGIEFEEVRPYQPGDEVRSIDWNVTARTGEPYIKTYVEERQLTLQFLVDTSLSMDFGSGAKTKREVAAEVTALLSFVAVQQQDNVGLTLFADTPGLHLAPEKGHRHVLRVVREVMAAPARGRRSSIASAIDHELRVLPRRALVFLVSDFLDVESDWERVLGQMSRRHDVVCLRVFDPFEEELPAAGCLSMREMETGRTVEVDTASERVRKAWSDAARARREALLTTVAKARSDLIDLSTAESVAEPIVRYFKGRAKRGGRR